MWGGVLLDSDILELLDYGAHGLGVGWWGENGAGDGEVGGREEALEGCEEEGGVGVGVEVEVDGVEAVEVFGFVAGVVGGEAEVGGGLGGEGGKDVDGDGEEGGVLVVVGYEDVVEGWEGLVGVDRGAGGDSRPSKASWSGVPAALATSMRARRWAAFS